MVDLIEVVEEEGKSYLMGVRGGWRRRTVTVQEVDLGRHGFGTKQTPVGLSPSPFLLALMGSGGEAGGGAGLLQALNTLVPCLELPRGSLSTLDLCQWKEALQRESLFLRWEDSLYESGLLQRRAFVPGPWEEGSPGSMSLGDVGGSVGVRKNGKNDWDCFGVMQVGHGSTWG